MSELWDICIMETQWVIKNNDVFLKCILWTVLRILFSQKYMHSHFFTSFKSFLKCYPVTVAFLDHLIWNHHLHHSIPYLCFIFLNNTYKYLMLHYRSVFTGGLLDSPTRTKAPWGQGLGDLFTAISLMASAWHTIGSW